MIQSILRQRCLRAPRRGARLRLERLEDRRLLAADLSISEFLAVNDSGLKDEDGERPDWIEIHNTTAAPVDLAGWRLTDDAADLAKWTFPHQTLPADGYLVVFASGKDRATPGANLHANFKLAGDGEYLALVQPDGAIARQFAPAFPAQVNDLSYGIEVVATSDPLIGRLHAARAFVPPDDALGTSWTAAGFDDSQWSAGTTGVGYDATPTFPGMHYGLPPGGWQYLYDGASAASAEGAALDGSWSHANGSDEWDGLGLGAGVGAAGGVATSGGILTVIDGSTATSGTANNKNIYFTRNLTSDGAPDNLLDAGVTLYFRARVTPDPSPDLPAADGGRISDDGRGMITVHQGSAGAISFSLATAAEHSEANAPGGGALLMNHAAAEINFTVVDTGEFGTVNRLPLDPLAFHEFWITIRADGVTGNSATHRVDVYLDGALVPQTFFVTAGTAADAAFSYLGLGLPSAALTGGFDLDYLAYRFGAFAAPGGYRELIGTDLAAAMQGVNASAYARTPFSLVDPADYEHLTLRVKYDDGFVAYLNGVEVARRNAPDDLAWNSIATAAHDALAAHTFESIDLTGRLGSLTAGTNVLALHLLNVAADDDNVLALAELDAIHKPVGVERYFSPPTPGAANASSYLGQVADTKFDGDPAVDPPAFHGRGFYTEPFDVVLSTATAGAEIRYTTDGAQPTAATGTRYTTPIHIAHNTTLRVAAFKPGFQPTNVDTQTYLFPADVFAQPNNPAGFPVRWGNGIVDPFLGADYQMDPRITTNADSVYLDRLNDALRSIPSVSLVMPIADWFDTSKGIYSNKSQEGIAWERAVSAELFYGDGREGFQANAGIRLQGGTSTGNSDGTWKSAKQSLRLIFKNEYGPGKLHFDLFPGSPVQEFNTLLLDARLNLTWLHPDSGQRLRAEYIRDQFVSDLQFAMGQPATHGVYTHLFINGLYWGLYDLHELPDETYNADYFGGAEADYDVIKHNNDVGNTPVLVNGSLADWNAARAIANAGLASNASYQNLQQYIDVDNLIDYMIANLYVGNDDWPHKNWYFARNRVTGEGFRFFSWDAEHVLKSALIDTSEAGSGVGDNNPARIYFQLRSNAEFRLRVADRIQKHFFNGGPLAVDAAANEPREIFDRRAAEIDTAVILESARWGDNRRPLDPYERDVEWLAEVNNLRDVYFPQRSGIVLAQFRADGLYPSANTPAPVFRIDGAAQHGGSVPVGAALTLDEIAGTVVYYTTDGRDPRTALTGVPAGTLYAGAVALADNAHVKARRRTAASGEWSALEEATFVVDTPPPLRITELMYHAADPPAGSAFVDDDFEFVELANVGADPLGLAQFHLAGGVQFDFATGSVPTLVPGEHVVVVKNAAAFAERYGAAGMLVAGQYLGDLANGGEPIVLARRIVGSAVEQIVHDFAYDDAWYPWTDGLGTSLVVIGEAAPRSAWTTAAGWRPSSQPLGSPGAVDPTPSANPVVTGSLDSGPGSLRQAFYDVLATPGQTHAISFDAVGAGALVIDPASALPPLAEPVTFVVPAGATVRIGGALGLPALAAFKKSGTGTLILGAAPARIDWPSVTIDDGRLQLAPRGDRVLVAGALVTHGAGQLDLTDNALVVRAAPDTRLATLAQITALVASGAANMSWSGPGIASSLAAADAKYLTAVGLMLNDDGFGGPFYVNFHGVPVTVDDVLVAFARYGDANLDGTVGAADYARYEQGHAGARHGWAYGDFNHDGAVDGTDVVIADNSFNQLGLPRGARGLPPHPASPLPRVPAPSAPRPKRARPEPLSPFSPTADWLPPEWPL